MRTFDRLASLVPLIFAISGTIQGADWRLLFVGLLLGGAMRWELAGLRDVSPMGMIVYRVSLLSTTTAACLVSQTGAAAWLAKTAFPAVEVVGGIGGACAMTVIGWLAMEKLVPLPILPMAKRFFLLLAPLDFTLRLAVYLCGLVRWLTMRGQLVFYSGALAYPTK
ncbi:hypothetical protein [Streptomyces sp. NPDC054866]